MLVEADLHQCFGADFEAIRTTRSWRWLRVRILGLLTTPSRLQRAVLPEAFPPVPPLI